MPSIVTIPSSTSDSSGIGRRWCLRASANSRPTTALTSSSPIVRRRRSATNARASAATAFQSVVAA